VVANAGPPVFLSPEGEFWDKTRRKSFNPFILNDDVHRYFLRHDVPSLFLIPGSRVKLHRRVLEEIVDYKKRESIYNNLDSYIAEYRSRRAPHIPELKATEAELEEIVSKFGAQIKKIQKHSKIFTKKVDFPFLIDFGSHGKWLVDFSKNAEECFVEYQKGYYNYAFTFDPHLVALLFRNDAIDFEDYFLSMRFKCDREIDQFNEFLFAIFKNFDLKRLAIAEFNYLNEKPMHLDENEMFDLLLSDGRAQSVKRYCPHRQVDLKECGYINEDNELVCPLHGWKFSLETGHCVNNTTSYSIFKEP
jgi:nitrite reductase/ring-hydroxylating ferredoxin subunit